MAVSVLVAIRFPYIDLNAQALLNVADNSDGANAETVVVIVEGSADSGGGSEDDILVDDIPADMTSSEVDILADNIPEETTSSVVAETIDAPNNLFSDTDLEQLQNLDIPESIGGDRNK